VVIAPSITLTLPRPHKAQWQIIKGLKRFNVVCCGRRFGKTTLGINRLVGPALEGYPVGWFAPGYKYMLEAWRDFTRVLRPVTARVNSTERRIELVTGGVVDFWTLEDEDAGRSRKYKRVAIDEAAKVKNLEAAWNNAIRATLADYRGDADLYSTPKGRNFFWKAYGWGLDPSEPEWSCWTMPTSSNPFIAPAEIEAARRELPERVFRQEFLADFLSDIPGALWTLGQLDACREKVAPELTRVVVAVDPAISSGEESAETGIVVAGVGPGNPSERRGYVLDDRSLRASPHGWAEAAISAYRAYKADRIVYEANQGGEMVAHTLKTVDPTVPLKAVHASRGKQARAEPIAALYEQGRVAHIGPFAKLEDQLTTYVPGNASPDRMDALVWALTELMLNARPAFEIL
jgi:phage terminase large subunit-like protein